jgi:hypothetical protein
MLNLHLILAPILVLACLISGLIFNNLFLMGASILLALLAIWLDRVLKFRWD